MGMKRLIGKRAKRRSTRQLLTRQIDITLEGIAFALEAVETPPVDRAERIEARASMRDIEHEGDDARAEVIRVMLTNVTTPLDREDLFRASRSIDEVLDNARDFVREMVMWRAQGSDACVIALRQVTTSLEKLRDAITSSSPDDIRDNCIAARKEAGRIRRAYQEGLKELFSGDLTMETLKTRELLRRLDVIGLRLAEAADALLDGLIKRAL